jgi:hypothetical protein
MRPSKLPHPPPELLNLISRYLTSHGFTNTVLTLNSDRQRHSRLNKWEDDKACRKKADLGKIYSEWDERQKQGVVESRKKAEPQVEQSDIESDPSGSEDSDVDSGSEKGDLRLKMS